MKKVGIPTKPKLLYAPCRRCHGKLEAFKMRKTIILCKCGEHYIVRYDTIIGWYLDPQGRIEI